MGRVVRGLLTAFAAAAAFYFALWISAALLFGLGLRTVWTAGWIAPLLGAIAAFAVARFVWRHAGNADLVTAIATGAFITGAIGFSAGFFGPLILAPDSNQGPMLGIFITGPLGFVLGGIGGAVYWRVRGAHGPRAGTKPVDYNHVER